MMQRGNRLTKEGTAKHGESGGLNPAAKGSSEPKAMRFKTLGSLVGEKIMAELGRYLIETGGKAYLGILGGMVAFEVVLLVLIQRGV